MQDADFSHSYSSYSISDILSNNTIMRIGKTLIKTFPSPDLKLRRIKAPLQIREIDNQSLASSPDTSSYDCVFGLPQSHNISDFANIGPSLQTLLAPPAVCMVQPMQAPKPQPIRSSKLSSPSHFTERYTERSILTGPQA